MTQKIKAARYKPRLFFDRKVRHEGYTRTLSLGKVIPKDWRYVRIKVTSKSDEAVSLIIYKLLGAELNAQTKKSHTRSKQNT